MHISNRQSIISFIPNSQTGNFVWVILWLIVLFSCQNNAQPANQGLENKYQSIIIDTNTSQSTPPLGHGYEFEGNGKMEGPLLSEVYNLINHNKNDLSHRVSHQPQLKEAIRLTLEKAKSWNRINLVTHHPVLSQTDILNTLKMILMVLEQELDIHQFLDFYQIQGEDGQGNVHFTGYFTPELSARPEPDSDYCYPLYQKPVQPHLLNLTRKEIDQDHKLAGQQLEFVWTNSLIDNYFLQVQGSGFVVFPDGSRKLLVYGGKNNHPYRSLGKYFIDQGYISAADISLVKIKNWLIDHPDSIYSVLFQNPSYVFFKPSPKELTGSANIRLFAGISIATDPEFIPAGTVMVAEVPVLNPSGKLVKHELRILIAHDKGGAIKGPGHVDLYCGTGNKALKSASGLHHYGRIWLLKAK